MLAISRVLGELTREYVQAAEQAGRDCRLVIPGLTEKIAREIHEYLIAQEIQSYLVVGDDLPPDEEKRWIRPVGLTSKRIGSFVAVAAPGQLAHIQDSIRGSGGAIRSQAFSEEWPWIDNGNESFRFDGPVLNRLVSAWTSREEEAFQWLREFIVKGLVKGTRTSSWRAHLLLENTLGTFDPTLYPALRDVREKFLFHVGVPRPSSEIPQVDTLVKTCTHLCQQIVGRCQEEDDAREHARDVMVLEIVSDEVEQREIQESLDFLLDGLGRSNTRNLGLLAFHSCWGDDPTTHWFRLHADRLAELFGIKERPKAEVSFGLDCNRGIISRNQKSVVTFAGEILRIDINYKIPQEEFAPDSWEVALMSRKKKLVEQSVQSPQGVLEVKLDTSSIAKKYTRKIPLRLVLMRGGDTRAEDRMALHLCGKQRPALVVVEPGFDVIDATPGDNEETSESPDKKFEISEPVHIYLFHALDISPEVRDEDNKTVGIDAERHGIWRSTEPIDPGLVTSGLAVRVCKFGDRNAVLCFEAKDIEKGEFTLEDELRVHLSGTRDGRIRDVARIFSGDTREPYPFLGKLNDASRRRIVLAQNMSTPDGWKPLLTNLLNPCHGITREIGKFINVLGPIDGEGFRRLSLPGEAVGLLQAYSNARDAVRKEVEGALATRAFKLEHPVYASHPIFVDKRLEEIEDLLTTYMKSYLELLDYLGNKDLEWSQIFVLAHLDCVVHWDDGVLRNAFFLVGPWHPLVLAKRFMVQSALFARAQRFLRDDDGKNFRQLTALLERIHGFRWLPGLSANDRALEPVYVSATSDPGWHLAVKTNLATQSEVGTLAGVCDRLRTNFDLDSDIIPVGADDLASSGLASYMRAFPSRRSVGIRICQGYSAPKIVHAIDRFLHSEDGPTNNGFQLPGGVRLFLAAPLGDVEDVGWCNPPLYVYEYQDDDDCLEKENPDIYVLPPEQSPSFLPKVEKRSLPRGSDREAVFFEPLHWLTEGQLFVPKSVTYEFQVEPADRKVNSLGDLFVAIASRACRLLKDSIAIVRSVTLKQRLKCPWAIVPGGGLDPAILVKYVRDGKSRSIQDRALWDYKVDLAGETNSYYILSTIPQSFLVSVNGVFGRDNVANDFIEELGKIGIAIGGEALKSGRHALGVVGLVGAVRLFLGLGGSNCSPLKQEGGQIGFLIPVDSFASFFGHSGDPNALSAKRTDLLAIQLVLPESPDGEMRICACGVESKFVSGTYNLAKSYKALEQARSTLSDFRLLVQQSLHGGALPERLGLLALLRFGLRISSPSSAKEISGWVDTERVIYEAVLQRRYAYREAKYKAVLVTTEMGLRGVAETNVHPDGLWIRLNKNHWPGVSDTPQLENIRRELSGLFEVDVPVTDEKIPTEGSRGTVGDERSQGDAQVSEPRDSGPDSREEEPLKVPVDKAVDIKTPVAGPGVPLCRIMIGVDNGRRAIYYDPQSSVDPLDNLNMMVTGSSGTGKTQFLKYLIYQLRLQRKNILILDFKNDFASDTVFVNRALLSEVFVAFNGLPYNPLIPYPVKHPGTGDLFVQCGQHIAGVVDVLGKTYGLGAQQKAAVKKAISDAFTSMNIPTSGPAPYDKAMRFPDFSNVGRTLEVDNPAAYNRLDPLFTLGLFREEFRDVSFHSLVERSVVLDLSQIPSDEIKNALAQLVVMSAHAYYNSQPHTGSIRQVLVFDEAHRVLSSDFMPRLVRECRAYGVGTILSSQYPSDFPQEISASMATKIIHGNGRDIEKVKDIVRILGCEGQEAEVSNLDRFQAFVDNRHYPHTLVRTMNYPLFLVWSHLQERGMATRAEICQIEGLDASKLPVENLIRQLEKLGLAEERDGQVHVLRQDS